MIRKEKPNITKYLSPMAESILEKDKKKKTKLLDNEEVARLTRMEQEAKEEKKKNRTLFTQFLIIFSQFLDLKEQSEKEKKLIEKKVRLEQKKIEREQKKKQKQEQLQIKQIEKEQKQQKKQREEEEKLQKGAKRPKLEGESISNSTIQHQMPANAFRHSGGFGGQDDEEQADDVDVVGMDPNQPTWIYSPINPLQRSLPLPSMAPAGKVGQYKHMGNPINPMSNLSSITARGINVGSHMQEQPPVRPTMQTNPLQNPLETRSSMSSYNPFSNSPFTSSFSTPLSSVSPTMTNLMQRPSMFVPTASYNPLHSNPLSRSPAEPPSEYTRLLEGGDLLNPQQRSLILSFLQGDRRNDSQSPLMHKKKLISFPEKREPQS